MNMSKRVRGSVSILLTLVLLPMVTYATMIVDASRLQVARTNISGAGDLVLNAIMSDYNQRLEDMYGLFASTTPEEDIHEILEAYFKQTLEGDYIPGLNIEGQDVQKFINDILYNDLYDPEEVTDYLEMQLQSFSASPVTGSALANPNTLKRQIIEYMKYRGPVSIANTLIGKLEFLNDTEQQLTAVDKKVQYTQELGKVQGPCLECYDAIENQYNNSAMVINELVNSGVEKEAKPKDNLQEMLNYSSAQYKRASVFYLLDAKSPFNNMTDSKENFLSYKKLGDAKLTTDAAKQEYAGQFKTSKELQKDAFADTVTAYINEMNKIVAKAHDNCGYDDSQCAIELKFDRIICEPLELWRIVPDSVEKLENGEFARISMYANDNDPSPLYMNAEWVNNNGNIYAASEGFKYKDIKATEGGIKYLNMSKIKDDDTELMKVFQDLPAKDAADTTDTTTFNKQVEKAKKIFLTQWDTQKEYKVDVQEYAVTQRRLDVLRSYYNELWSALEKLVREEFTNRMRQKEEDRQKEIAAVKDHNEITENNYNEACENWENYYHYSELQDEYEKLIQESEYTQWYNENEDFDWGDKEDDFSLLVEVTEYSGIADCWTKLVDEYVNTLDEILRAKPAEPEYATDPNDRDVNKLWLDPPPIDYGKEWNDLANDLNNNNRLVNADKNHSAINYLSQGMSNYGKRADEFLKTAQLHNDQYYIQYANSYMQDGSCGIANTAMHLQTMSKGLAAAKGHLDTIYSKLEALEKKADEWEKSIKSETSESTKSAMLSDYNGLVGQINKEDVDKLRTLISDLKEKQVDPMLDYVKQIKFLGKPVISFDTLSNQLTAQTMTELRQMNEDKRDFFNAGNSPIVQALYKKAWDRLCKYSGNDPVLCYTYYEDDDAFKNATTPANENLDPEISAIIPSEETFSTDTINQAEDIGDELATEDKTGTSEKHRFDTSSLYNKNGKLKSEITHFRVLDGLKDDIAIAYTPEDQAQLGLSEIGKTEGDDRSALLDPDEKFMITLFNEARAAEEAKKKEESAEKPAEDIQNTADGQTPNPDAETEQTEEEKKKEESLASFDFNGTMKSVSGYCSSNVDNNHVDVPKMSGEIDVKSGDKAGESNPGGIMEKAKNVMSMIGDIGTKIVDNVYLEEYFTEMFTCRTDNPKLMTGAAKATPVIMLNGYGNSASNASKKLNENTQWYGKEIEYLLWGNSDLQKNMNYTDATIFAIRFVLNAIYAFTAADIQTYALEVATAIAGWTIVGVPIVQACITLLIALAESGYDIYRLHKGEDVPIYKSLTTFVCSPTNALKELLQEVTDTVIDSAVNKVANTVESKIDSTIDGWAKDAADLANHKLSEFKEDLIGDPDSNNGKPGGLIGEFGNEQMETIKNAVTDHFITPLMNRIASLQAIVQISQKYSTYDIEKLITDEVDKVFEEVQATFTSDGGVFNQNDVVHSVCMELLNENEEYIGQLKAQFTDILKTYLSKTGVTDLNAKINSGITAITDKIDSSLESVQTALKTCMDNIIKKVDDAKKIISDKVDSVMTELQEQIVKHMDDAASTAKSLLHNQFTKASAVVTNKAKTVVGAMTDMAKITDKKPDLDTNTTTVTLNYKEYCKILMLAFVTFNQQEILQRAAVLITANMRNPSSGVTAAFDITQANTLFSVNAQVNMMTLFPWPVRDELNDSDPNGGLQFDLNGIRSKMMTINYCGVNGY